MSNKAPHDPGWRRHRGTKPWSGRARRCERCSTASASGRRGLGRRLFGKDDDRVLLCPRCGVLLAP
jgi:ribosomal protein S27AE